MSDHQYFTIEATALTIPKGGALAIYCGDAPRTNKDGSTSHSMRGPLLIMPPDMFQDASVTLDRVAYALNKHAALFYPSARPPLAEAMKLPEVAALVQAARAAIDGATSTYKSRNGKNVSIEADDGEQCLIVHSDFMHDLRAALAPFTAAKETKL